MNDRTGSSAHIVTCDQPYGAIICPEGVLFRIFSRHATKIWLLFFDHHNDLDPANEIELNPNTDREGDNWQIFVENIKEGQLYLYRIEGEEESSGLHAFDPDKYILDPYAKAVTNMAAWGDFDFHTNLRISKKDLEDKMGFAGFPKCVVVSDIFDWENDERPEIPLNDTIIYEGNVRSLTFHPESPFSHKGTYKGVIETIPYLLDLGITTLELLPVFDFNELEISRKNPLAGNSLVNLWGYSTISFFAPNGKFSTVNERGEQVREFKEMVKALHSAGIEIILDVVFNHTAEGGKSGDTYNFKGIDNSIYYILGESEEKYKDYSGCGNTLNCNHPIVRKFIVSCLEYWYSVMRVDGFRFDLASILCRGRDGKLLENPPLIEEIAESPVLREAKLIAEPWDAGGGYQVGSFPSQRFSEWNGKFRDDVRAFLNGDEQKRPSFAYRVSGNSDLYNHNGKNPFNSVNFVTSHDGFTLMDLVSYERKHNEDNMENNKDGSDQNFSVNFGVEGETKNTDINRLRLKQIKNFFVALLLSRGVPMFPAGDEFGRTQKGNNNAYCQDNGLSWIDWSIREQNSELLHFCKKLIAFRKNHSILTKNSFFKGFIDEKVKDPDIFWFDVDGKIPEWEKPSKSLGFLINGIGSDGEASIDNTDIMTLFNSDKNSVVFRIPEPLCNGDWYISIQTGKHPPEDVFEQGKEPYLDNQNEYVLEGGATAVFIAK